MHKDILLEEPIEGVLRELRKLGICTELNCQYRRIYNRLKKFAERRNMDCFSPALIERFLADVEQKYIAGQFGRFRRNHLRRASLLLQDYVRNGAIEWKIYVVNPKPMPTSQEFLLLYSRFIDNLKFYGRSENTIQSSKNLVRQFLLFLEDSGCTGLLMTPPVMVQSFFQHLLATYSPTSIRTVASHIRSFLSFAEGGEQLLPLVPSHCTRNKPIIPILTDKEDDALKSVLKTQKVSLRDKAIILLALRTGLRAVDIVKMKLEDIDWINDAISIIQSKTGNPFKIPLAADVGNVLSSYILNERPKTENSYVFLRSLAPFRPLSGHSACYAVVRKIFHQAEIRLGNERKGIHVIRHSTASKMLSKGVPVTTISSMLGHSNKASTDIYLTTNTENMRTCAIDLSGIPMHCKGLI
ncbi:MAG: site-specific integrase [Spirochaetales bacterium]|nr:site-specific integrase [Spirochaetales bacterium]